MGSVVQVVLGALCAVWYQRAEICVTAAALAGWALLTWGVAALTVWQVWPLSAGLLLLGLCGVRLLWTVVREGLYALSRAQPVKRRTAPRA